MAEKMELVSFHDLTPAEQEQIARDMARPPVAYSGLIKREATPAPSPSQQEPTDAARPSTTPRRKRPKDDKS